MCSDRAASRAAGTLEIPPGPFTPYLDCAVDFGKDCLRVHNVTFGEATVCNVSSGL